jgi:hypothetical protein
VLTKAIARKRRNAQSCTDLLALVMSDEITAAGVGVGVGVGAARGEAGMAEAVGVCATVIDYRLG